jgi:Ca2+-binding EF-hand superfamily protein
MLQRSTDPGSSHWVQDLQSGRATVRDIVRAIATSQEHQQRFWYTEAGEEKPYIRSVNRLYRHILGRQPDAAGASAWADVAARNGEAAVIDQFLNSAEYNQQYGTWGVPGSGGLRYCGPNNQGAVATSGAAPSTIADRRFRVMDANNDGRITRAEWRGSARSFDVHDWNNDGILSGDELWQGSTRAGRTFEDEDFDRGDQFEFLDVNNNNRVELREWHGDVNSFRRLDRNNDNRLSRAELSSNVAGSVIGTSGNTVIVDARRDWTDTGLTVREGDTLTFDAQGTVQLSGDFNDVATAAGVRNGRRAPNAPLARAAAGGLIARIGNSGIVMVGERRSFTAPASGRLFLGVNDDYRGDNSGEFRVIVGTQGR